MDTAAEYRMLLVMSRSWVAGCGGIEAQKTVSGQSLPGKVPDAKVVVLSVSWLAKKEKR